MKRVSLALTKRLEALEVLHKPPEANAYMHAPEMATDIDLWSCMAVLQQEVLKKRVVNANKDDSNYPYPDALIEYEKNLKWVYIV